MDPLILNCRDINDKIVFDWIKKQEKRLFRDSNKSLLNSIVPVEIKDQWEGHHSEILISKGDMAKLVDATDLIGLSLGRETY